MTVTWHADQPPAPTLRRFRLRVQELRPQHEYFSRSQSLKGVYYFQTRIAGQWTCDCHNPRGEHCKHLIELERRALREGWDFHPNRQRNAIPATLGPTTPSLGIAGKASR